MVGVGSDFIARTESICEGAICSSRSSGPVECSDEREYPVRHACLYCFADASFRMDRVFTKIPILHGVEYRTAPGDQCSLW